MEFDSLVTGATDDERIKQVAERLARKHGQVVLRREASGLHAYMACPKCLQAYGRRELKSKHLAFNVEKYLGIGQHALNFLPSAVTGRSGKKAKKGYAQCMKEHGKFSLDELEKWPSLEERGIDNLAGVLVMDGSARRYLVPDDNGNMVPDGPGETVSILSLPSGHPCMDYIESRGYDPSLLHAQFRAEWCVKEAPEGEQFNRFYRRHSNAWKSTPQGRLVFYSFVAGVRVCWQARYLEMNHETGRYVWHPYAERWEARPDWPKGEEPVKYMTASSALRNAQLCGYDAVRLAALSRREEDPCCVLTEGPLDAARFPDRGVAVLGKNLSDTQAQLLRLLGRRVIIAFDSDAAGLDACERAEETLRLFDIRTKRFFTPEEFSAEGKVDVGELGYEACAERVQYLLNTF